jgi:hypothetical protein
MSAPALPSLTETALTWLVSKVNGSLGTDLTVSYNDGLSLTLTTPGGTSVDFASLQFGTAGFSGTLGRCRWRCSAASPSH